MHSLDQRDILVECFAVVARVGDDAFDLELQLIGVGARLMLPHQHHHRGGGPGDSAPGTNHTSRDVSQCSRETCRASGTMADPGVGLGGGRRQEGKGAMPPSPKKLRKYERS